MKTILCSYFFFITANALDILSSLHQLEANPAMQDAHGIFDLRLGIEIKLIFLLYYFCLSLWLYVCMRGFNKTLATIVASAIPAYATYAIFGVAFDNILTRIAG